MVLRPIISLVSANSRGGTEDDKED